MVQSTAFRAIKTALLVLLMAVFGAASFANAAIYTQTDDNENNAHTGIADDDLFVHLTNDSPNAPIEFNIDMTGDLPTYRAALSIKAFDIDSTDVTELFLNGQSLGPLTVGPNSDWATTIVEVPFSLVKQGKNLVEIRFSNVDDIKVQGGMLLIDVGVPDNCEMDPAASIITAEPATITADGASTSEVTLTTFDTDGKQMEIGGAEVVLSTTLGTLGDVTDQGDGTYTATLTSSTTEGTAVITGTVDGVAVEDNAEVRFVALTGPVIDPGSSLIDASDDSLPANGTSNTLVTLTTFDDAGEQLTTGGAVVELFTTLGSLGAVTDNDDGTYTAQLTSAVTAGVAVITGKVNDVDVIDTAEVEFVAATGPVIDAINSLIEAADDSIAANGTSTTLVTLTTYDTAGDPLTTGGAIVTLATTLGTLGTVTDNNDGTYTATLTSATTAGTAVITGVVNDTAVTDTAEVEFVASTGPVIDAINSLITAADESIAADGTSTTVVTLTTFDTAGDRLTTGGAVVTLATTLGTLGAVADNGDGTYTATLTSATTEGTAVITGTVNDTAVTDTAEVQFVAPGAPDGNLETAVRGGGSSGLILLSALSALAMVRRKRLGKPLAATLGAVPVALAALPAMAVDYQLCSEKADFGIQLPSCWYVGAGIGISRLDPDDDLGNWVVDDKHDVAFKGLVGYHVLPHVFLEASYAFLGDAVVVPRDSTIDVEEEVNYKTPAVWAGYMLFDPASRWNLYLKAGTAKLDTDARDIVDHEQEHNWQLALSGGVQYRFSRRWFARLEVDSYDKDARAAFLTVNRYFGEDKKRPEPAAPAEPAPAPVAIAAPVPPPSPPPCKQFSGVLNDVNFATAKAVLTPKAKTSLNTVVSSLKEFPKMEVEISAHTDSRGSDQYNMGLSQERADSVVGYLNQSGGIASGRMQAKSYGESRPIADNTTVEGMAKNRRVEIKPTNTDECVPAN
jgi:outer membrane protein OmpA-like peptidoglycan-associated protein